MSDVKITVGGATEEEAARRFIDAGHRAENRETFHERHLAFEIWDALARVLTGKRMELLRYVRRHDVASIRALEGAAARLQQCPPGCSSAHGGGTAGCHGARRPR